MAAVITEAGVDVVDEDWGSGQPFVLVTAGR